MKIASELGHPCAKLSLSNWIQKLQLVIPIWSVRTKLKYYLEAIEMGNYEKWAVVLSCIHKRKKPAEWRYREKGLYEICCENVKKKDCTALNWSAFLKEF